jgi:hypothetical protein
MNSWICGGCTISFFLVVIHLKHFSLVPAAAIFVVMVHRKFTVFLASQAMRKNMKIVVLLAFVSLHDQPHAWGAAAPGLLPLGLMARLMLRQKVRQPLARTRHTEERDERNQRLR